MIHNFVLEAKGTVPKFLRDAVNHRVLGLPPAAVSTKLGIYWLTRLPNSNQPSSEWAYHWHRFKVEDSPGGPCLAVVSVRHFRGGHRLLPDDQRPVRVDVRRVDERFATIAGVVRFVRCWVRVPDPLSLLVRHLEVYVDRPVPIATLWQSVVLSRVFNYEPWDGGGHSWRYGSWRSGYVRVYDKARERRDRGFPLLPGVLRSRVEVVHRARLARVLGVPGPVRLADLLRLLDPAVQPFSMVRCFRFRPRPVGDYRLVEHHLLRCVLPDVGMQPVYNLVQQLRLKRNNWLVEVPLAARLARRLRRELRPWLMPLQRRAERASG